MPISEESSESIFKQYIDIFSNIKKKQIHLNIIIMGKSGHGKSTLINAVFRDNLVREGIGKPVTQNIDEISKKDIPLTIFDTPGFELNTSQQNKLKSDVQNLILQRFQKNDQNQAIHCIWYCISTELGRLEKYEIDYINSFKEYASKFQIPVIIILTKSYDDNKKREMLNCVRTNLRGINVVPVLAKDMVITSGNKKIEIESFGLNELIDVVDELLPEMVKITFQNVQKVSLKHKKKICTNSGW